MLTIVDSPHRYKSSIFFTKIIKNLRKNVEKSLLDIVFHLPPPITY